jgi:hypothetical protein
VAPLVVFVEALAGRRVLAPGDGYQAYLPWFTEAAQAWRHGHFPGWNPWSFAGSPLLAIGQAGVYYPPNWLHMVLPPVMAMNVVMVAQFVIAGVGAWLLARHLTGDAAGAAVAGVAFALCGFMFGQISHASLIASAAWMPWVLYGYDRLRKRFTPGNVLVAGGPLALSFLAGHSQLSFVILLVAGVYALGTAAFLPRETRGRPIFAGCVLVAATLGLSAAQLVPTVSFLPLTSRVRFSYADAMTFSLPADHTPLLAFPYLYGDPTPGGPFPDGYTGRWSLTELSGYPGMAALVLAAAGLTAGRRDRRLLALAGSGIVAGALALGPDTPLSRLVYHVPVYGQFRSWGRYLIVVDLVVAVFAAYGVAALRQSRSTRAPVLRPSAAVVAAVAGLAVLLPRLGPVKAHLPPGGVRLAAIGFPLVAAGLGLACALALSRHWRGAVVLTVVVLVADAASFGLFSDWRNASLPARTVAAARGSRQTFWGGVDDRPGGLDRYLFVGADIAPMGSDFVNATDYKGLRSANGSGPLVSIEYLEALGMSPFGSIVLPDRVWRADGRALDLLRVTTVVLDSASVGAGPPPEGPLRHGVPLPGTTLVRFGHIPTLPEAFLVGRAEVRPRPAVLDALHGVERFDPASVALLERLCRRCPTGGAAGPAGEVRRRSWGAGSATFEVSATRPAVLVVSQTWLPGWTATVAGLRVPTVRVDGLVQGVPVPAGRHRVALRYDPPGAWAGLAVSLLTVAGLLVWLAVSRRPTPAS